MPIEDLAHLITFVEETRMHIGAILDNEELHLRLETSYLDSAFG
jgi:hypothetical protein